MGLNGGLSRDVCGGGQRRRMQFGDKNHHPPTWEGDGAWLPTEAGICREPRPGFQTGNSCGPYEDE